MDRLNEIATRKAELKAMLESNVEVDLNAVSKEIDSLESEERAINEAIAEEERKANEETEMRKANAEKIAEGKLKAKEIPMEDKEMENVELRNTAEYGKAFVNMIITGKDDEVRSLLSSNVGGSVPVPTFLENEIKNAWEEATLMQLVKKTDYKGNVKIGFELSSTGAVVHTEGTDAIDEEVLTWGAVELKAESIKKFITISDEAIEGTTIDTLGEIYKELAQRIVEKAEDILVNRIVSAPAVSDATHCGVPTLKKTTMDNNMITEAVALTSSKARKIVLVMNKQTHAMLKGIARNGNFAQDIFDGYEVRFTEALKPFATASTNDTYIIAGDFGYGAQANFPNGYDLAIKVDDLSLAEKDLVKVVGREYVGIGVVAPKSFVKIVK